MSLKTAFRMMPINPALRTRLAQQNQGRVSLSAYDVRTGVIGQNRELIFRLLEVLNPPSFLNGTPYRILACEPNQEMPLFPTPVGHFDYRVVRFPSVEATAISSTNHDAIGSGDKLAVRVNNDIGQEIRGIGRAMASIALNHVAEEGARNMLIHNVMNLQFFLGLSKTSEIVEAYDLDRGKIDLAEADEKDENVVISVEIATTQPESLPRIMLTLRSQPL